MVYERETMRSHRLLARLRFRERVHKGHQTFTVVSSKVYLQGVCEAAFQAGLPTGAAVVQICAASSHFTRWVNDHSIRAADNTHQLPFRQYGATSNASSLGNVLHTLNGFLGHLYYKALP